MTLLDGVKVYVDGEKTDLVDLILELKNDFEILSDYLQYKNIIVNDQEYKQFKESHHLVKFLNKKN